MDALEISSVDGAVTIAVFVKPRASKTRVLAVRDGRLDVAVAAPPVDGEANEALRRALGRHFGVARSAVTIISGETSRAKRVRLEGLTRDELLARLAD